MRRGWDSGADMPDAVLSDREVELILAGSRTGSEDLAKLERFVAEMSRTTPPHDTQQMATALAATARSTQGTRGLRRMATIAASAALLVAMSGIAMAADDAAPGDALYPIDRALETIGIGDGGIDERLEEFDALLEQGDEEEAFQFLRGVIDNSPEAEASDATQHLEAAVDSKPTAKENNGSNEPALESSPGQAISTENRPGNQGQSKPDEPATQPNGHAIGQDDEAEPPGQEKTNENRAEPETAGPKDDNPPGQADNPPGQADNPPGQADNPPGQADNKSEEDKEVNGQPDHADPQNDNDPPGQNKND